MVFIYEDRYIAIGIRLYDATVAALTSNEIAIEIEGVAVDLAVIGAINLFTLGFRDGVERKTGPFLLAEKQAIIRCIPSGALKRFEARDEHVFLVSRREHLLFCELRAENRGAKRG